MSTWNYLKPVKKKKKSFVFIHRKKKLEHLLSVYRSLALSQNYT